MKYRAEIDGLRAVAVLPVILFHAGFSTFSGGFVGVDVFFVISGYLITSIILKELEAGTFSFWEFYERRTRRILPALLFVIICCIPFAWMWMMPREMREFAISVRAVSLFVSNFWFWQKSGYFDQAAELKPLIHTWSLAVEEQFYIIFPIAMLILWRFGRKNVVATIALVVLFSLALSEYGSRYHPSFNFYWLPTRAWELGAGSLCAFVATKPTTIRDDVLSVSGLAAIVFAIFYYDSTTPFPSLYALVPVLGTCAIILFARQGTIVSSLLSLKAFVGIGLISYSAYLWHQPLFAFARIRSLTEPTWQIMLLLAGCSLVLGYFSWRYIEGPARKRGVWPLPKRKTVFAVSGTFVSLLVAFGSAGHFTNGFPSRLPPDVAVLAAYAKDRNPNTDCISRADKIVLPNDACVYGNKDRVQFALIGDSHAHASAYQLGEALAEWGLGVMELTHSGCPPIRMYRRLTEDGLSDCDNYFQTALEYLRNRSDIDIVVLHSRWPLYAEFEQFDNGEGGIEDGDKVVPLDSGDLSGDEAAKRIKIGKLYQAAINELLEADKRVVIIYPQPEIGWNVPVYLAKMVWFGSVLNRPLSISYKKFRQRSAFAYVVFDGIQSDRLLRVLPEAVFCDRLVKGRCVAEDGTVPYYYDDDHLNSVGASLLAKEVLVKLRDRQWISK